MKSRTAVKSAISFAVSGWISLSAGAEPIEIPNAGFEERASFDPFPDGTDKYNQFGTEFWRHFEVDNNGGPLRIWNPGDPGNPAHLTDQGIADVGFGGEAPEGDYVVVVRSRYNDDEFHDPPQVRDFEAAVQLLEATFDPAMTYTLTAKVGRLPGSANYTPSWYGYSLQLAVGGTDVGGARFQGRVEGGTVIARDDNSVTVPEDTFVTASVTYTPDPAHADLAGLPLQIRLAALEDPADHAATQWVAFDDVTLEVTQGPPSKLQLEITNEGEDLLISWPSEAGRLYNLRSEIDPSNGEPGSWPVIGGSSDIEATPPTNTLALARPGEASRFFVIEGFPAPPEEVFGDDFESGMGGWTTGSDGAAGTVWEIGTPDTVGPVAAQSGDVCFGTNLTDNYADDADIWLRSPAIDLSTAAGATLNFFHYVDIEATFDSGTVSVLDASNNENLGTVEMTIEGNNPSGWESFSRALPAAALGKTVMIEFRFQSDDFSSPPQAGWYIDDVVVSVP